MANHSNVQGQHDTRNNLDICHLTLTKQINMELRKLPILHHQVKGRLTCRHHHLHIVERAKHVQLASDATAVRQSYAICLYEAVAGERGKVSHRLAHAAADIEWHKHLRRYWAELSPGVSDVCLSGRNHVIKCIAD